MRPYSNLLTKRGYFAVRGYHLARKWLPLVVIAVVSVAVVVVWETVALQRTTARRARWEREAARVEALKRKIHQLHAERTEVLARIAAVASVTRGVPPAWTLQLLIHAVQAAQQNVALRQVQFAEALSEPIHYTITVSGIARTHQDVASFVQRLRAEPVVREVKMLSLRSPDTGTGPVEFEVAVKLGAREEKP